jgi:hypothetical protein
VAVVGEAHIIVRALTNRVKPQIEDAFSGLDVLVNVRVKDSENHFNEELREDEEEEQTMVFSLSRF